MIKDILVVIQLLTTRFLLGMSQLQIYLRCMQSVVFYLLASYLDLEFSHFKSAV